MARLLLCFSHTLTKEQQEAARRELGVHTWISLPPELQEKFQQVPPNLSSLREYVQPIFLWLEREGKGGDYVLIQGDYGLTFLLVQKAFALGLQPIYATTARHTRETRQPDGSLRIERVFRHVRFRHYEWLP